MQPDANVPDAFTQSLPKDLKTLDENLIVSEQLQTESRERKIAFDEPTELLDHTLVSQRQRMNFLLSAPVCLGAYGNEPQKSHMAGEEIKELMVDHIKCVVRV